MTTAPSGTQHTPGPWIAGEPDTKGEANIYAPNGSRTESNTMAFRVLPHNAAFIVKACNMHEELVEALETLLNMPSPSVEDWQAARALLIKANE